MEVNIVEITRKKLQKMKRNVVMESFIVWLARFGTKEYFILL